MPENLQEISRDPCTELRDDVVIEVLSVSLSYAEPNLHNDPSFLLRCGQSMPLEPTHETPWEEAADQ